MILVQVNRQSENHVVNSTTTSQILLSFFRLLSISFENSAGSKSKWI